MRFLSIRIVHDGSHHLRFPLAVKRVLALIISLLPLCIGYLAILRDPRRRGWHDRMTGTEVVYDMSARTARRARTSVSTAPRARDQGRSEERASPPASS